MGFSLMINLWRAPWMEGSVKKGIPAMFDQPRPFTRYSTLKIGATITDFIESHHGEEIKPDLSYNHGSSMAKIHIMAESDSLRYIGPMDEGAFEQLRDLATDLLKTA